MPREMGQMSVKIARFCQEPVKGLTNYTNYPLHVGFSCQILTVGRGAGGGAGLLGEKSPIRGS